LDEDKTKSTQTCVILVRNCDKGHEVFVVFSKHMMVVCVSNNALESAGSVVEVGNVGRWGHKHLREQFSDEVYIFAFALESDGQSGDALV